MFLYVHLLKYISTRRRHATVDSDRRAGRQAAHFASQALWVRCVDVSPVIVLNAVHRARCSRVLLFSCLECS